MRIPSFIPFFGKRQRALAKLGALTPTYDANERAAHAHAVVDELRGTRVEARVKRALDARLPESAVSLLESAGIVLAELIEDDLLRSVLGHRALQTWLALEGQRDACLAFCIARAHRLTPLQLWQLMIEIEDASEAYDVFAPIYRAGHPADTRALLAVPFDDATARRVLGDPRMVDLALETVASNIRASCTLLGLNGSARAVDELRAILEHPPAEEDPWAAAENEGALAAIDGLADALPHDAFIDTLASFLAAQPHRLVPWMYLSMRIAQYAIALDEHPLIRANPSLRAAVAKSALPPPMAIG